MNKPGLADTHLHLQAAPSASAYTALARAQGVQRFYCMCSGFGDLKALLQLKCSLEPHLKLFMGCHPAYLQLFDDKAQQEFEACLRSPFISGIGEVGLDGRFIDKTPLGIQLSTLKYFLDTACALDLPVSLHCVKAHNEMLSVLKTYQGRLRFCLHGANLSAELLEQYLRLGGYVGVGALILNPHTRLSRTIAALLQTKAQTKAEAQEHITGKEQQEGVRLCTGDGAVSVSRAAEVSALLLQRLLLESDFDGRPLPEHYYLCLKQRAAALLGFGAAAGGEAFKNHTAEALLEAQLYQNERDFLNEQVLLCN